MTATGPEQLGPRFPTPWEPPPFAPSTVWLVGAGPGDPGLLTLTAHHALRAADVIVYDALVHPQILGLARPGAALEFAGKRGGQPSAKQVDISERLVHLARAGHRVLRLKGGDPFVFGRGAEEALRLVAAGIPFRIVPGVTSGVAAPAYAGIPLTHRETNTAVTFLTGHSASGNVPDTLNWDALAQSASVLVIYMGLTHLNAIVERLRQAGRGGDEPVAVIASATTDTQEVRVGTLATIAEQLRADPVESPALIVVGPVVALRPGLDWLGALQDGRDLQSHRLGQQRGSAG